MRPTWTWVPAVLALVALAGVLLALKSLLVADEEEEGLGILVYFLFGGLAFLLFARSGGMTFILAKPTGTRPRLARRFGLLLFSLLNMAVGVLIVVASGLTWQQGGPSLSTAMFGLAFLAVGGWAANELVKDVRPQLLDRSVLVPK